MCVGVGVCRCVGVWGWGGGGGGCCRIGRSQVQNLLRTPSPSKKGKTFRDPL